MKKFLTVSVLLLAALALSGCLALDGLAGLSLKDCESNQECFEAAAKTCEPAKVTAFSEDESISMDLYSEIRGLEGDKCLFYLKVTKFNLKTPDPPLDSSEQELFNQMQQDLKKLEGNDMLCRIPKELISAKDLFSITNPAEICTGSLITFIGQLQ